MPDLNWELVYEHRVAGGGKRRPVRKKLEYSGGLLIYVASAPPGTATSAAAWLIMKLVYSGTDLVDVLWSEPDVVYDSRASLTYT